MDAFVAQMTATDAAQVRAQAEAFNATLAGTRVASNELGRRKGPCPALCQRPLAGRRNDLA